MYILIVITIVYGGSNIISMQDFTSKETCEAAKKIIPSKAYCIPK